MLKFTKDHEWLKPEGEALAIGITDHAQQQLGDVVFVELPAVGASFAQGATAATVESVKAASDVYAPITGEIVAVNEAIVADPSLINKAAQSEGWFFKMRPTKPAELDALLDETAYKALIA